MRPSPRAVSATFLFALPAGMAAAWVGLPLPWMIGPLLAVALLRVRGHELASPRGGRQAGQWVIGVALGLHFTPQVLAQLGARAGLVMAIAASALLLGVLCAELTRRLSGADRVTAFFASLPGGASEMAVLAERYGGAVDLIAAAHALRLVVVVVAVPCALGLAGAQGSEFALRTALEVEWSRLLALFAASLLGVGLLCAARVANAWILGPLLVVGALCAAGLPLSALPGWLLDGGQLLIGCALGCRFGPGFFRKAPRFISAAMLSTLLALALATLLAAGFGWWTQIPLPTLALAAAPGGIAEMSVTAQVLQLGVPLVTACHVLRVLLLTVGAQPLYRLLAASREAQPG